LNVYLARAIQHMSAADKADGIKGFLKLNKNRR